ncbi:MAG: FAD-dependent oxidoreductase [bacterium]|nr:FAD-dependent oxidoreductase [bacterium]
MSYTERFKHKELKFGLREALEEADRCVLCYDAPCSNGCPGDTAPAEFIRKLRMRNITGAIRTIKTRNILGSSCGLLCPVSSLCEKECSTTELDSPIKIGLIQKALIEHSWKLGFRVFEKPEPKYEKVAVVGSGPAGLSCASELAKEGFRVTIFEAKAEPGGILRYGIPSFRYPEAFLQHEIDDVTFLGVEIKCNAPIAGKNGVEDLLKQGFDAVFVAAGLWKSMRLSEQSARKKGVVTAIDFLEEFCEKRFDSLRERYGGKTVVVIGGGSTSIDCVEAAVEIGAKDVYLIYRRSYTEMLANEEEKSRALGKGVHFLLMNQPKQYVSNDDGSLMGVGMVRTKLGNPDASGRRKPERIIGSDWILEADAVVEAIGTAPVDESPDWYPSVKLTASNKIDTDPETGATSVAGVFAGGDIVQGPELVITAVQEGKQSAWAIKDYLEKKRK